MRLYNYALYVMIVGLSFLPAVGASDEVWHITTVETVPDSIRFEAALALDNNGNPHIVYLHDNGSKYVYFDGVTWQTESVDTGGTSCSIAVDSGGRPHILVTCMHDDAEHHSLVYGYRDESGWELTLVDQIEWYWDYEIVGAGLCSLALDSSGRPRGCYMAFGFNMQPPFEARNDVRYVFWDGASWNVEVLETVDFTQALGGSTSISIDSGDLTSVTYIIDNYLKYTEFNGTEWETEIVCTCGEAFPYSVSLVLDPFDNALISYKDYHYGYYQYCARQSGTSWNIEQLESVPYLGGSNSIALDSNNNPRISFTDEPPEFRKYTYRDASICFDTPADFPGVLKYVYWDGSVWHFEEVDSLTESWTKVPIAVDANDIPHIAYGSDDKLLYASRFENTPPSAFDLAQPADGGEVTEPVTVDWEDSTDDDGDTITYDIWYSTDASFDPHDEVTELADSTYTFPEGVLTQGETYYWKVRAWDGYDETWSGPDEYWSFTVNAPPGDFDLTAPPNGSIVMEPVTLDWEDSTDPGRMLTVGADSSRNAPHTVRSELTRSITYDIWYSTDPSFDPHEEVNELTDSTYTFPEGVLSDGTTYYWKVRAWDGYDETWSGPDPYWSFTVDNELGVPVMKFMAEGARNGIELTWEYAGPDLGFNLYRSEEVTGLRSKLGETLNAELIVGESPYSYLDAVVESGVTYAYWLEAIDASGASETFGPVTCTSGTFVPSSYALYQSRPNPARGTAVIAFDLPEDSDVTLAVYDFSGRKVTTLVNVKLPAGAYERPISNLAPGVYVYRLAAGEFAAVRKMVVAK